MPTNAATVSKYLDFAILQLGAESYLHGLDRVPSNAIHAATIERWEYGSNDASHRFIDPLQGWSRKEKSKLALFADYMGKPGKQFYVTGHSLGGHLATSFTLMHENEVTQAYTFNGAGVGR